MSELIQQSFPLTDIQLAYFMGRDKSYKMGGVSAHVYYVFEGKVDKERYEDAVNNVIKRQDMLRAVIKSNGEQYILDAENPPKYYIDEIDISGLSGHEQKKILDEDCEKQSHYVFELDRWPFFSVVLYNAGHDKTFLRWSVDLMIADGSSLMILLEEIDLFYRGLAPLPLETNFKDFVFLEQKEKESIRFRKDQNYWRNQLNEFPPAPDLVKISTARTSRFSRKLKYIEKNNWDILKKRADEKGLSPTVVLGTAYAEVLSYWSGMDAFTINMTFTKKKAKNIAFKDVIGDFTSSLLINLELENGFVCDDFWNDANSFSKKFTESYRHNLYSGILFSKDIAKKNNIIDEPVMPIVFTSMLFKDDRFDILHNSCAGKLIYGISQTPQVYLDCQVMENNGALSITWDYAKDILDGAVISAMFEQYVKLITNLIDNKNKISESIFADKKISSVYSDYNQTDSKRKAYTLFELLHTSMKKYSANIAVNDGEKIFTYNELDKLSSGVASNLQKKGISPGKFVAVYARRCAETIVNILAIIKSGAAYVPINPDHPLERRNYIMKHAECSFCLYPEDVYAADNYAAELAWSKLGPTNAAYVIYTSGSTGEPKGVVISNDAVCNTIEDINRRFNINETDVFIGISSFCFDLSVYDVFGSLSAGASLMLIKNEKDISNILNCVITKNITVWNTVPAFMELLMEEIDRRQIKSFFWDEKDDTQIFVEDFGSLKTVMLSGDWIPLGLPDKVKAIYPYAHIYSLGGATEAAIWSIYYPIKDIDSSWSSIPYGYPLSNQKLYVLDTKKRLCPCGVIGEIHIGGQGIAVGYQNDNKKTEEAFIIHPQFGRLYKTGDYGVLTKNNHIDFKGRRDFQVKIRGHRIELGEIENILNKHRNVENSVVLAYRNKYSAEILCAYVKLSQRITEDELITWCGNYLPDYMVPGKYIFITQIPLTANGKIDRKALPKPNDIQQENQEHIIMTQIEKEVLEIWKNTLNIKDININSNYFEVGGDSISLMRIVTEIENKYDIKVSMHDVLMSNTARKMANLIDRMSANTIKNDEVFDKKIHVTIDEDNRHKEFQLTDVQMAYLLGSNESFEMGGVAAQSYYEIITSCDPMKFEKALNQIIQQQPMLRTVFTQKLTQKILDDDIYYKVLTKDISSYSPCEQKDFIEQVRAIRSHLKYDIQQWPLFSFEFIKINKDRYHLMINFNLLIADGTSMRILIKDLLRLLQSSIYKLPDMKFSFRDYIYCKEQEKRSHEYKAAETYWNNKLKSIPPAPQLIDHAKVKGLLSHRCTRISRIIDRRGWNYIKKLAKENKVTPSAFLCSLYAKVLSFWSNQQALTLNITVFNRRPYHEDVANMIGDFTSIMLIDVMVRKNQFLIDLISQVQEKLLSGLENQIYDGINVVRDYAKINHINGQAVMPYVFTSMIFNDDYSINYSIEDFGELIYSVSQTPQVFLDCQVMDTKEGLSITWDYVDELFDREFINTVFNQFITSINTCINTKSIDVDLPIKTLSNDNDLWANYNDTNNNDYPPLVLAELLNEGWKKPKNKVAIVDEEKSITYEQLNKLSDKVAIDLSNKGIGAGDYVAVLSTRCVETIINIIGIVKSGAAYIPISEDYPELRRKYIIDQVNCKDCLDKTNVDINNILHVTFEPIREISPTDHAYIIYTSGSTGLPKGVVITNQSVCNTIRDINNRFGINTEDKFISISSFCFDLSVYDIFGSISRGCTLIIESDARDILHIAKTVYDEKITVWNTVPAIMELLVNEIDKENLMQNRKYWNIGDDEVVLVKDANLRVVLLSGDWVPLNLHSKIRNCFEDAAVYSLGGATEASIWSIYYPIAEVDKNWKSIPYGYPLSNQQIYVLNYENSLCPIGVTGEIYIGGSGVAIGYVNDKARTSESFFEHEEFGYIYRTGDYGYLSMDGYIVFQGRKDSQVKINGYRIELGEIENVIQEIPQIENASVMIQEDNGNFCLSAYIVCNKKINHKNIEDHIAKRLPPYMLPKYYLEVPEIILTTNGKVDKQSMPKFKINKKLVKKTYPRTKVEKQVAEIVLRVLECGDISIDDNFYDFGGDSLKAIQIYSELSEYYNVKITDIFEFPNIRLLSAKIKNINIEGDEVKQQADLQNKNIIQSINDKKMQSYKRLLDDANFEEWKTSEKASCILITGTTGYLGAYVLENYLLNTKASIITIVRAESDYEAWTRVKENFAFYFDESLFEKYSLRIKILKGNLETPQFGLTDLNYMELFQDVELIVNCAADTSHFGNYENLRSSNVISVKNILEFLRNSKAKLCHISTSQIHTGFKSQYKQDYFIETDTSFKGDFEDYYSQTKHDAEKCIFEAKDIIHRSMVLRVGNISCCYKNGKFQKNIKENAAYSFIKLCLNMHAIPVNNDVYCDFSFVDDVSEGIRLLASSGGYGKVYHVANHKAINLTGLATLLTNVDPTLTQTDSLEFKNKLDEFYKKNPMSDYIGVSIANLGLFNTDSSKNSKIVFCTEYTDRVFETLNFSWNSFTHEVLEKMLDYMKEVAFL